MDGPVPALHRVPGLHNGPILEHIVRTLKVRRGPEVLRRPAASGRTGPWPASMKIKSKEPESPARISPASPSSSVIFSSIPARRKFSFASGILFSYFSIVVIRQFSGITDAIKSAEYPTAVPTSRILAGETSVTIVFKSAAVSLRMIGTLFLPQSPRSVQ